MLILFGLAVWFWLLYVVFGDLFSRPDLGGWAKAAWAVALILLPFLGCLAYLVTRGRRTGERRQAQPR
jgi:hypothetical protein